MLHSDLLRTQIEKDRQNLSMLDMAGWENFLEEVVDEWQLKALKAWKSTPAEHTDQIIECQAFGKCADVINAWAVQVRTRMKKNLSLLELINHQEMEDVEVPKHLEPETRLTRLRTKVKEFLRIGA